MSSTSKNTSELETSAQRRNQRKEAMYAFLKNSNAKSTPKKTPTKKRKKTRKKVESFHSEFVEAEIDWNSSSDENPVMVRRKLDTQEAEIIEDSSEDENRAEPPVVIRQDFTPKKITTNKTPTKKYRQTSSVKKKKLNVLPLSPITPGGGLKNKSIWSHSNTSFKLNQTSSTLHNTTDFDDSLLAIPLVYSDDELPAAGNSNDLIAHSNDLAITTTSSPDESNPDESRVDDFENSMSSNGRDSPQQHPPRLATRGRPASSWIENLVDRLDNEDSGKTMTPATYSHNVTSPSAGLRNHDSDKKQKYIKGGLATQLQLVLRQEKSDCVLFRHNINSNKNGHEGTGKHLQMQIISLHREGVLYVMECRIVSRGHRVLDNDDYVTVLLRQRVVIECRLQLGDVFTVYPPWKKMDVEGHDFPVLLCVNNITTEREEQEQQKKNLNPKASGSGRSKLYCESLLEALERCDVHSNGGISIAATIQRVYYCESQAADEQVDNKWTLLCEDAFGMFFELTVDLNHCADDVIWTCLVKEGEGQRVCFERVHVCGRTTKNKCPRLFEIIASVWNPDGFGLHQIRNSQSTQDSGPHAAVDQLPVPNFAYRLVAYCCRSWHSLAPASSSSRRDEAEMSSSSNLNRPPPVNSTATSNNIITADVLYRPPSVINLSDVCDRLTRHNHDAVPPQCTRFSFLAKLVHISSHCDETEEERRILIFAGPSNSILVEGDTTVQLHFTGHNKAEGMEIACVYLVKDVRITSDRLLVADGYSRFVDASTYKHNTRNMIERSELDQLLRHKLANFPIIDDRKTKTGDLVRLHGVVISSTTAVSSSSTPTKKRELGIRVSAKATVVVNNVDGRMMKMGSYFSANCYVSSVINHDEDGGGDVIEITADVLSPLIHH